MKYFRSRPWRSRGPWFSNRAGARRRGFRDDALWPAPDGFPDGDDVVISVESESIVADDVALPDATARMIAESMLAARVDVSGLLAIASSVPRPLPVTLRDDAILGHEWHANVEQSDDESLLSRHSA